MNLKELKDKKIGELTEMARGLGIENGAAHSELRVTAQGPALIETGARLTRAQLKRAIPYGAMIVILAGAPAVQGEVAVRQRELLQTLNADERLHVAVALEGEGPAVVMKRVLARAA